MAFKYKEKKGFSKAKYVFYLLCLMTILLLCSCSISPEIENKADLNPATTKIKTPKKVVVINHNSVSDPSIEISWDPVDKATFYEVEYQSATDYQSGKDMKSFLTNVNSFSIKSDSFTNPADMRFVFRVKAGMENSIGKIYSDPTDLKEGAIINSLNVSPVIDDNKLRLYSDYPKNRSVLTDELIIKPTIKYYDGDFTAENAILDESKILNVDSSNYITLASAENKIITAVLLVGQNEVLRKKVEAPNLPDYIPPALEELTASTNEEGAITLNWKAKEINAGLPEDTTLKFEIWRKESTEKKYIPLKDGDNNLLIDSKDTNYLQEDGSFKYVDNSISLNKDYDYTVVSYYYSTVNKNEVIYAERNEGRKELTNVYAFYTVPKSFTVEKKSGFDSVKEKGEASYSVNLKWENYHDLPENASIKITRSLAIDGNQAEDNPTVNKVVYDNSSENYDPKKTTIEDTLTLSEQENRKEVTYTYYIQYVLADTPLGESTMVKYSDNSNGLLKTLPSVKQVNFIVKDSFTATSGADAYSNKVQLSWIINKEEIKAAGLNLDKVKIKVLRSDGSGFNEIGSNEINKASFDDINVEKGKEYSYIIQPYYEDQSSPYFGNQAASNSVVGSSLPEVKDITASINKSNNSIELTWSTVENASSYDVYYKKHDTTDAFTKYEKVGDEGVSITDSTAKMTISNNLEKGVKYDIAIAVVDKYEPSTATSISSQVTVGSILGVITPTVTGGETAKAKEIAISWEPVENAKFYTVKILSDETENAVEVKSERVNETEYTFSTSDLQADVTFDYPLSRPYYVQVIPSVGSVTPLDESPKVAGNWIMPPKNITATKASYRDLITVSWDAVDGATGYTIYRKTHGTDDDWEYLDNVSSSTLSYDNYVNTSDSPYDYSVSSSVNGEVGIEQNFFINNSNYGYILYPPKNLTSGDMGNGFFKFSWKKVEGATHYIIKFNDENIGEISTVDIEKAPESLQEITNKSIELTKNGIINFYLARPEVKHSVDIPFTVAAKNENAEISTKNTTTPVGTTVRYSNITDSEIVNLVAYNLNDIFSQINNSFDKEWWPASRKQMSDSSLDASTCWGTSGFVIYNPKNNGYINLNNYQINYNFISGNITCMVSQDQGSGYLGDDPLERINTTNDLLIQLPGKYDDIHVSFSNYYIDNKSGGTIKILYGTKDISPKDNKLPIGLLQEV